MSFWNDRATTDAERHSDDLTRHIRRALGLTAVFGDEGRGLGCYNAVDMRTGDEGVSVSAPGHGVFIPFGEITLSTPYAEIRRMIAESCPALAEIVQERRAPDEIGPG